MPYYAWRGVTLVGTIKKGKIFANDERELDALLLARDIALLSSAQAARSIIMFPITLDMKIQFFQQLGTLLSAGVLLPEALRLVALQLDHQRFQEAMHKVALMVHAGVAVDQAAGMYANIFSPLMIHVMHIGQETGRLAQACQALCSYLHMIQHFQQSIRRAMIMPAVTAIFFILVALIILVWVVPQFSTIFASLHAQLPPITRFLLRVSNWLCSWKAVAIAGIMVFVVVGLRIFRQSGYGRRVVDTYSMRLPGIGSVIQDNARAQFLRSLAVLIYSGVRVPVALPIASGAIANTRAQLYVNYLAYAVTAGSSLGDAMMRHPEQWFEHQVVALVKVGEEAGDLAHSLELAAQYYQQRVEQYLYWYSMMFQPLCIVVLGIFIALFIAAVYMPIFSMAHHI